jgi:hypothetical protein
MIEARLTEKRAVPDRAGVGQFPRRTAEKLVEEVSDSPSRKHLRNKAAGHFPLRSGRASAIISHEKSPRQKDHAGRRIAERERARIRKESAKTEP